MLVDVLGILGLVLLLGSFVLSTAATVNNKIKESSARWGPLYNLSNFIGALLLAYYAYTQENWIFVILEGTWSAVGLVAVLQKLPVKKLLARKA